jgi:hypothetical protein
MDISYLVLVDARRIYLTHGDVNGCQPQVNADKRGSKRRFERGGVNDRPAIPDHVSPAANLASIVNTSLAWVNVSQAWSMVLETWANTFQPPTPGRKPRSRQTKPGSWQMSRSSTVRRAGLCYPKPRMHYPKPRMR